METASTRQPAQRTTARFAFWTAAALGSAHAAWSIYWALGGTLLLDTVGQWAVEAARESPGKAALLLAVVSAAKLAAAWIPILAEYHLIPWRRAWRALVWLGGPALILYGGADIVAGSAVLLGLLDMEVTDRAGLLGHTFIWGPHFALWGASLTTAMVLSRPGSTRTTHQGSAPQLG